MRRKRQRECEVQVGDIVVKGTTIVEPRSNCRIAYGFPTELNALAAAREMNEIVDWTGAIKTRARGESVNYKGEIARIASDHGGTIADGGGGRSVAACANAVEQLKL